MRLSPDGRAMAFVAGDGEGRMDAYVSTVPVTSAPTLVAERVSSPPRWSRAGGRIYYMSGDDTMMTLIVSTVPSFTIGPREQLFKLRGPAKLHDVSHDGRFLLLMSQVRAGEHPIAVWTAAIASTQR
jgi:Tol biopolymer transport system component